MRYLEPSNGLQVKMPSHHVLKLFMPNEFSLFEEKNITEQGVGLISGGGGGGGIRTFQIYWELNFLSYR